MILVCNVILQGHVIKGLGIIQKVHSLRSGGGGRGGGVGEIIEKRTKTNRGGGERGGPSMFLACSLLKKTAEIFKMKFYSYSPVLPIDYNGGMKY